jgi:hypothetical protein
MSDKERKRSKHRRDEKLSTSASPSIRKSRTRSMSGDEQSVVSSKDRDLSTSDRSSKKTDPEGKYATSYGSSRVNSLGERSSAKSVDRDTSKSNEKNNERKECRATSDRSKSRGPESREGSRSRSVRSERRVSRKDSEKSVDQDRSKSKETRSRKGGSDVKRDRSKSKGPEPTDRSERRISRNASSKSSDRDKSKISDSKEQHGSSHTHTVADYTSESNGQEYLEGSIPISFESDHGTKSNEDNDLNNSSLTLTPSVRRKRMADFGRSKRHRTKSPGPMKSPSSIKSPGCIKNIENKDDSDQRKSAVSDSLKTFLEDGKGTSSRKARDEASLGSSMSKIQRRKSKSIPTVSTASLFGGQLVDSQGDECRERRRSRSSSVCPVTDGSKEPKSSRRSKTPSARTRLTSKRTTTEDSRSKESALGPSGESLVIRSATPTKRRVTKTKIPEGPGFPTLSLVDMKCGDVRALALDKTVVESTSRIRERQLQRRGSISHESPRSSSLGALDGRLSSRTKMSLNRSCSSNLDINLYEELSGGDGLSSSLSSLNRSLTGQSRIKSTGNTVVAAQTLQDKHKNESISGKRGKDATKSKRGSITKSPKLIPSHDEEKEEDLLAKILGMPKFDKESLDGDIPDSCDFRNDSQASMASLDPSILTNNPEPAKKIRSILELYRDNVEGIEGELELNDSLTHSTQASLSGTYKLQQHGSPSVLSDPEQYNRSMGPGSLSPHSSIVSDTNSPGILKRPPSETISDSSSSRSPRVSWVELPFANPGMILLKSADHDGNHENETMASVDSLSTLEDVHDEVSTLADAIKLVRRLKSAENLIPKKRPSLGATLENDKGKLQHRSTDERTVGTANTGTSEATMKTENKAENKSEAIKAPRKGKKSESVLKKSTNDDKHDESLPSPTRKPLCQTETSSSTEIKSLKAGSKIRYIKKNDDVLQSSGEPSSQRSRSRSLTKPTLVTTPVSVTKSYLNRRNMVKGEKAKSQLSKSSVMSSLDSFLERAGDSDETELIDNRSTQSDGLLKKPRKILRARRTVGSDDRSVSSAPLLNTRRKRLSLRG